MADLFWGVAYFVGGIFTGGLYFAYFANEPEGPPPPFVLGIVALIWPVVATLALLAGFLRGLGFVAGKLGQALREALNKADTK